MNKQMAALVAAEAVLQALRLAVETVAAHSCPAKVVAEASNLRLAAVPPHKRAGLSKASRRRVGMLGSSAFTTRRVR